MKNLLLTIGAAFAAFFLFGAPAQAQTSCGAPSEWMCTMTSIPGLDTSTGNVKAGAGIIYGEQLIQWIDEDQIPGSCDDGDCSITGSSSDSRDDVIGCDLVAHASANRSGSTMSPTNSGVYNCPDRYGDHWIRGDVFSDLGATLFDDEKWYAIF
jgi:hypothetical protein